MNPFAFNSLSRDHSNERWVIAHSAHAPFNSLSRDHFELQELSIELTNNAFNSLSRDHRVRFRDFPALRGVLPRHPFAQMIPKATIWIYRSAPL